MRKSIIAHEHHPIRCLLASRMGFPVGTPRSRGGLACPPRKKQLDGNRATKRPSNEALNAVRRFGDNLRDIPVSAYDADGTRRRIVIRPTSIQDVYYYYAPR